MRLGFSRLVQKVWLWMHVRGTDQQPIRESPYRQMVGWLADWKVWKRVLIEWWLAPAGLMIQTVSTWYLSYYWVISSYICTEDNLCRPLENHGAGSWETEQQQTSSLENQQEKKVRGGLHRTIQTSRRRLQIRTWPQDQRQDQCGGEPSTSWAWGKHRGEEEQGAFIQPSSSHLHWLSTEQHDTLMSVWHHPNVAVFMSFIISWFLSLFLLYINKKNMKIIIYIT